MYKKPTAVTAKCKYCRKTLKKYTRQWWSTFDKDPEPKVGEYYKNGKKILQIVRTRMYRKHLGGQLAPEKRITYWLGESGYYGNSHFCSCACGYRWAVEEWQRRDKERRQRNLDENIADIESGFR